MATACSRADAFRFQPSAVVASTPPRVPSESARIPTCFAIPPTRFAIPAARAVAESIPRPPAKNLLTGRQPHLLYHVLPFELADRELLEFVPVAFLALDLLFAASLSRRIKGVLQTM